MNSDDINSTSGKKVQVTKRIKKPNRDTYDEGMLWSAAISVVASSGDRCKPSRPIMPHSTRSSSADGPLRCERRTK